MAIPSGVAWHIAMGRQPTNQGFTLSVGTSTAVAPLSAHEPCPIKGHFWDIYREIRWRRIVQNVDSMALFESDSDEADGINLWVECISELHVD